MRKESSASADKLRGGAIVKHLPKRALSLALSAILVIGLMPSLSWAQDLPEAATQDETAAVVDDVATDGVAAKVAAGEVAESDTASMVDGGAETPSVSGNAMETASLMEPLATDGDATDQWDGTTLTEPTKDSDVYQISNGAELAWFMNAATANAYAGNAILTNNINMGTLTSWYAAGSAASSSRDTNGYQGTFDGNGKSVTMNLTCTSGPASLFRLIGSKGVVKNLTLNGSFASNTSSYGTTAAAMVVYNYGTITNCVNNASMSATSSYTATFAGGIVGYENYGVINYCINHGAITSATTSTSGSAYAAGIAGHMSSNSKAVNGYNVTVEYCYNDGAINASTAGTGTICYARSGGIIGYHGSNSNGYYYINNCLNAGEVKTGKQIGGITGAVSYSSSYASKQIYKNCFYVEGTAAQFYNSTSTSADAITMTDCGSATTNNIQDADWVKTNLGEWFVTLLNLTPDTEPDVSITISDNYYVLSNAGESADQIYSASITSAVDEGYIPVYNNTQFVKCADGTYRILIDAQTASAGIKANEISFVEGTAQTVSSITDINGNGKFNIVDVQIIYDMAAGNHSISNEKLPMASWLSADVLGDGVVDATDAYKALYNLVFPEGETL